jgi:geranyl diphosphate 2-C-methyltransferase
MGQEQLTGMAQKYYEGKQTDRNLQMSDGVIVNHHFGLGDFDRGRFPSGVTQPEITRALNKLELNQIDELLSLVDAKPGQKLLDAGCGRGGTSIVTARRTKASVLGVTLSSYQADFAQDIVDHINNDSKQIPIDCEFRAGDFLKLELGSGQFDHVIINEASMYAYHLSDLFTEMRRVMKKDGVLTIATMCINDDLVGTDEIADTLDEHYSAKIHTKTEYAIALENSDFKILRGVDATDRATPYWELRSIWEHSSGIEKMFLDGYKSRKVLYLFIQAKAV